MAEAVASFVGRTKLKLAIDSACSTQDDPIPIYVLDDLVQQMAAGDTRSGVDALVARLAHRSPIVKQKALRLATHIGRKGSPDLRRLMARQSGAVRELLHFRCEPDPFKGDTVWKRVQEYAQEALNAIHGEPDAPQGSAQGGLRGRIQGFGSEGAGGGYSGGGGGYGGGGSSGMLGFGSDSAGGGYGGSSGGGSSGGRMVGFGSADVMQSGMQAISSGIRSLSGRHDGYTAASQVDSGSGYGGGGGRASGAPLLQGPIVGAGAPALAPSSGAAAAADTGTRLSAGSGSTGMEQRLVDRVCLPAGLRAAPSRDDLRVFVDGISSLDGPTVAQLLERKLDAGPWQSTLRALCAIEAVAEGGSSAACGQVGVHFQAHPEAVRRAAASPQASVRQRAQKVLALLGHGTASGGGAAASQHQLFTEDLLGEAEPSAGTGASSAATSAAALADLLGEAGPPASGSTASAGDLLAGLDVPAAAVPPPPLQAAAVANGAADDLFGGMLLGGQPVAAAPAAAAPAAAAPAPAAAPADPLDLLGGLSMGGPPAAASAPAPAPAAPHPAAAGGLDDLLGGLSLGPAPVAPPLGGGGGLAMGGGPALQPMQQQPLMGGAAALGSPTWGAQLGGMAGYSSGQGPSPFHPQPPGLHHHASALGGPSHGRQPSLGSLGSGPLPSGALASSGILDSAKDNSFNFVDDALAAARRKQ